MTKIKTVCKAGKNAWSGDLKWCNYVVCGSLFNNQKVKLFLFSALKFRIKFVQTYDFLPPLHIFATSTG